MFFKLKSFVTNERTRIWNYLVLWMFYRALFQRDWPWPGIPVSETRTQYRRKQKVRERFRCWPWPGIPVSDTPHITTMTRDACSREKQTRYRRKEKVIKNNYQGVTMTREPSIRDTDTIQEETEGASEFEHDTGNFVPWTILSYRATYRYNSELTCPWKLSPGQLRAKPTSKTPIFQDKSELTRPGQRLSQDKSELTPPKQLCPRTTLSYSKLSQTAAEIKGSIWRALSPRFCEKSEDNISMLCLTPPPHPPPPPPPGLDPDMDLIVQALSSEGREGRCDSPICLSGQFLRKMTDRKRICRKRRNTSTEICTFNRLMCMFFIRVPDPEEDQVPYGLHQLTFPRTPERWMRRKSSSSRRRSCMFRSPKCSEDTREEKDMNQVQSFHNPLLCSRRRQQRRKGNGRGKGVPVPGDHVPQSEVVGRTTEEKDMNQVPNVHNPLLCSRRRQQRRKGNGRGKGVPVPGDHVPQSEVVGRHKRREGNEWGGGVPVPGEDYVPRSQEFLILYYVPEEDTREEEEMGEDPVPGEDHVPQSQEFLIHYYSRRRLQRRVWDVWEG